MQLCCFRNEFIRIRQVFLFKADHAKWTFLDAKTSIFKCTFIACRDCFLLKENYRLDSIIGKKNGQIHIHICHDDNQVVVACALHGLHSFIKQMVCKYFLCTANYICTSWRRNMIGGRNEVARAALWREKNCFTALVPFTRWKLSIWRKPCLSIVDYYLQFPLIDLSSTRE